MSETPINLDEWAYRLDADGVEVVPVMVAQALQERLAATLAERDAARVALLCPGQMRCAKCKFELTRRTLFALSGTVGAGTSETEPCPNGCGPLWPVTWEQEARSCYASLDRLFDEKQKAEAERDALAAQLSALRDGIELAKKMRPKPVMGCPQCDALAARVAELEKDAGRLDFMIQHDACYVYQHPATPPYEVTYQVHEQDEDEGWHIISGEGRFFKSQREAIDAALSREEKS